MVYYSHKVCYSDSTLVFLFCSANTFLGCGGRWQRKSHRYPDASITIKHPKPICQRDTLEREVAYFGNSNTTWAFICMLLTTSGILNALASSKVSTTTVSAFNTNLLLRKLVQVHVLPRIRHNQPAKTRLQTNLT